jgi:plastocyanin
VHFRLAILVLFILAGTASAGTVTGTITFTDDPPVMQKIDTSADPACAVMHADEPLFNEALVLGEGQTMGNILVRVIKGVPEKEYPVPTEPVEISQAGCRFEPRMAAVMKGQTLRVLNPDGIMHNVNGAPRENKPFNRAMPKNVTELDLTFDKTEDAFMLRCDIHPWMRGYVAVVDHPYFDVTEKDGVYTIEGLPAGEYEIEAFHERLKGVTATVTVPEDGEVTQDFSLAMPKR